MYNLEVIYNNLLDKNKLDDKIKYIINKFINKINIDSKYTDSDSKEHTNYKEYKNNNDYITTT